MKEYKLQCHIMTAKGVKATDRFIMLCIAKSVDWSTWSRDIAMSAIYNKYDIPVATFSRSVKSLKALGWINVVSNRTGLKQHHTTITVYPNIIMKHETTVDQNDKPTVDQNDKLVDQNDKAVDQIDKAVDQNEVYININNTNNINNQADEQIEYVTRADAIVYTNKFHPRDLRHLADDREKVPLHILSATNKRYEIDRRVAVVEEARGRKMGHHERMNFVGSQRDEDAKIYHAHSFEFKNIRKVW